MVVSSTTTGELPKDGAAYSPAKAAMEAAAFTLAREEREHGIRVNVVAPGLVATDRGERLVAATAGGSIADLDAAYPYGRVARPADVAGVVAFLASQDGEYLTGQRIEVDGGGPEQSLFHCRGGVASAVSGGAGRTLRSLIHVRAAGGSDSSSVPLPKCGSRGSGQAGGRRPGSCPVIKGGTGCAGGAEDGLPLITGRPGGRLDRP
ncbi:SDR family oxidoreductase [Pseudonocardia sp. RS11V-5]|nr:SDR family oxidoreductase [Pseudonocardia terrae]